MSMAPRDEAEMPTMRTPNPETQTQQETKKMGIMGSLRVIELQLVAFIMVFSISGLVPFLDIIFTAFASLYIFSLSRFAFPTRHCPSGVGPTRSSPNSSNELFQGGRLFRFYVVLGTTIGLFLPLAYVLGGFARGDEHAVRLATPHLFLLAFQILTENVVSGLSLFSPPVRALVPLLYTVRRIFVILEWMHDELINKTLPANAQMKDFAWYWFGRSLAVANLGYFSFNLLFFLVPQFLPRAFERYFNERDEIHMKLAEDKWSAEANTRYQPTDKKSD